MMEKPHTIRVKLKVLLWDEGSYHPTPENALRAFCERARISTDQFYATMNGRPGIDYNFY